MSSTAGPLRLVVLADTHLRTPPPDQPPRRWLPPAAEAAIAGCAAILHAGDVLDQGVLDRLAATAPVHAVLGNNDTALAGVLAPALRLEVGGVRVAMIHDSGARAGRAARMNRRFPDAQVVVFGHSHQPCDEVGVDGQRLFNPGSPTQRRSQPRHTMGELVVGGGAVLEHRIIPLD